jgi:oligoendopeptidase F
VFYDLDKEERKNVVAHMADDIFFECNNGSSSKIPCYFSDEDTYIRKSAYLAFGRIFEKNEGLQSNCAAELIQRISYHCSNNFNSIRRHG